MIKVVAGSPDDGAIIVRAVGCTARVVQDEGLFTGRDVHAACVIVACRHPIPPERLALLQEIERKAPWIPVILLTDRKPGVARQLCNVRVSDIVWFESPSTELRSRIDTICRTTPLPRLADEIESSGLPPALRSALAYSLRSTIGLPVPGVKELAAAVCYSPVTLSQEYRVSVGGVTTLSEFLSALAVARAHLLRLSGLRWEAVAGRLGLTRQTLYRKAKRWPGRTLAQLEQIQYTTLVATFVSDFGRPLLN